MCLPMARRITAHKILTPGNLTNSTRPPQRNRRRQWSGRIRHSRSPLYSLTSTSHFKLTRMRVVLLDAKMMKAMARLRTSARRRSNSYVQLYSSTITRYVQSRDSMMCYSLWCSIRPSSSGSISLITICKISIRNSWTSLTLRPSTFMATTSRTLRKQESYRTCPNFRPSISTVTSSSRSKVTACGYSAWCMRSMRPLRS